MGSCANGEPRQHRPMRASLLVAEPMFADPLFTVVMPVYNKARHVEASIRSVLDQTCDRFELIVVDDASSDGSREVIESISSPRLRILEREVPGPGGYAARNLGISVARGEWITFLDADDTWAPDRLERLLAAIQAFPEATLHACAWYVATSDGGVRPNKYARRHAARGAHVISLTAYLETFERNEPPMHTDTVAVHTSALERYAVFPADRPGRRGGDVFTWLRLMCQERRLAWSSHVGATYFVDSDNMVTRKERSTAAFLTRSNIAEIEVGLPEPVRIQLRRAANQHLWRAWLGNVTGGGRGFFLPGRLIWSGTGLRTSVLALLSLTPGPIVRLVWRLGRLALRRE